MLPSGTRPSCSESSEEVEEDSDLELDPSDEDLCLGLDLAFLGFEALLAGELSEQLSGG